MAGNRSIVGPYNHNRGSDDTNSSNARIEINGLEPEFPIANSTNIPISHNSNNVQIANNSINIPIGQNSNKVNLSENSHSIQYVNNSSKVHVSDNSNKLQLMENSTKVIPSEIKLINADSGKTQGWSGYEYRDGIGVLSANYAELDSINKTAKVGYALSQSQITEDIVAYTPEELVSGLTYKAYICKKADGALGLGTGDSMDQIDTFALETSGASFDNAHIFIPSIGIARRYDYSETPKYQYGPLLALVDESAAIVNGAFQSISSIGSSFTALKAKDQDGHMFNSETKSHRFEEAEYRYKPKSGKYCRIKIFAYWTSGSYQIPTKIPGVTIASNGWEYKSGNWLESEWINLSTTGAESVFTIPYYEGNDLSFFVSLQVSNDSGTTWEFAQIATESGIDGEKDLKWFDVDIRETVGDYIESMSIKTWSQGITNYASGSGLKIVGHYVASGVSATGAVTCKVYKANDVIEDHNRFSYTYGTNYQYFTQVSLSKIKTVNTSGTVEAESLVSITADNLSRLEVDVDSTASRIVYDKYMKVISVSDSLSFGVIYRSTGTKVGFFGFKHNGKFYIPKGSPAMNPAKMSISSISMIDGTRALIAITVNIGDSSFYFTVNDVESFSGGIYSSEKFIYSCIKLNENTPPISKVELMSNYDRVRPASLYMLDNAIYKNVLNIDKFGLTSTPAISIFATGDYLTDAIVGFKDDVEYAMSAFVIPMGFTVASTVYSTSTAGLSIDEVSLGEMCQICTMPIVTGSGGTEGTPTGEYVSPPQRLKDLYPEIARVYKIADSHIKIGKVSAVVEDNYLYPSGNFILIKSSPYKLIDRAGKYYSNGEVVLCVNNVSTQIYGFNELGPYLISSINDAILDNPIAANKMLFLVGKYGLYALADGVVYHALKTTEASDAMIDTAIDNVTAMFAFDNGGSYSISVVNVGSNGSIVQNNALSVTGADKLMFIKTKDSKLASFSVGIDIKVIEFKASASKNSFAALAYTLENGLAMVDALSEVYIIGLIVDIRSNSTGTVVVKNGTTALATLTQVGLNKVRIDPVSIRSFQLSITLSGDAVIKSDVRLLVMLEREVV